MSDWTFTCWACGGQTQMEDKVGRKDECPHCHADMHSCKNCEFYDPSAHNECRETISEYIPDKERANFCGMFRPAQGERKEQEDVEAAKAKLEALFKK